MRWWFGRTLTFELVADEGAVGIGALLEDASDGAILCADSRTVGGYAAHGEDIAAAVAPLVEAFAVELHDDGEALRSPIEGPAQVPAIEELGAGVDIGAAAILEREQAAAGSVPSALALTYYDPSRDFQTGQARVSSPAPSRLTHSLTLPCVLDAGAAKSAAENLLLRAWALRERLTVRLPPAYLDVTPGARFRLPNAHGDWVSEEVEVERFVVTVTLRPLWLHAGSRSADPGRGNPQPDVVAAPTRLALFDLPDPETNQPVLALAAASPSGAWSPVPIEIGAGGTVSASRSAPGEAILGEAITLLGPGQPFLLDLPNAVDVQLANPDHWLQSRDDDALAMGANLAAIGDELVQFGRAEALSLPGRFRLSKLLRGRRGSEWAMAGHTIGEDFVLLDARAIKAIPLPVEMLGTTVTVTAHGAGESGTPPSTSRAANGEAMRPLSPAHLSAAFQVDGSLAVRWLRRSRLAWAWLDEVDAPPDPSLRGYRLSLGGPSATIERDCLDEQMIFSASEVAALGSGPIEIQVRQIGSLALSRPETLHLNA